MGRSERGLFFWLNWFPNSLPYSRFGFIATKKVGNAVRRHRGVRLVREAIRLNLEKIKKGVDMVFVLKPSILGKKYCEVEKEVVGTLRKAGLMADDH